MTANPKDPPALILLYRSSGSTEELIFTQASISCPKGYTIPAPRIIPAAVYALFSRCAVHQQQSTMNSSVQAPVNIHVEAASADPEATDEAQAELADAEYAKIDKVIEDLFGSVPENLAIVTEDSGNHGGLIGG